MAAEGTQAVEPPAPQGQGEQPPAEPQAGEAGREQRAPQALSAVTPRLLDELRALRAPAAAAQQVLQCGARLLGCAAGDWRDAYRVIADSRRFVRAARELSAPGVLAAPAALRAARWVVAAMPPLAPADGSAVAALGRWVAALCHDIAQQQGDSATRRAALGLLAGGPAPSETSPAHSPPRPPPPAPSAVCSEELRIAREAVGSLRKREVHDGLRHAVPPPPAAVAAAVEAAATCIGCAPCVPDPGWETVLRVLCDPLFCRKLRDFDGVTRLQPQQWRRLRELLRRAEGGCGSHPAAEVMRRWAAAAVAAGLVLPQGAKRGPARRSSAEGSAAEPPVPEAAPTAPEPPPAAEAAGAGSCSPDPVPRQQAPPPPAQPSAAASRVVHLPPLPPAELGAGAAAPAEAVPQQQAAAAPGADEAAALQELRDRVAWMEQELRQRDNQLQTLRRSLSPVRAARAASPQRQPPLHEPPQTPFNTPASQPAPDGEPRASVGAADSPQQEQPLQSPQQGQLPQSQSEQQQQWEPEQERSEEQAASHAAEASPQPRMPSALPAPRLELQPVTPEAARALRQTQWRAFCRLSRRDMHERELQRVGFDTLLQLLQLYGVTDPVAAARVELAWAEAQGRLVPDPPPPPAPPAVPVLPPASPPRRKGRYIVPADPEWCQGGVERRRRAASAGTSRPSHSVGASGTRTEQPIGGTPETVKGGRAQGAAPQPNRDSAGAALLWLDSEEGAAPPPAAGLGRDLEGTPRMTQVYGASCNADHIGTAAARANSGGRRSAPTGRSDPNTLSQVQADFFGAAQSVEDLQRGEFCAATAALRGSVSPRYPAAAGRRGRGLAQLGSRCDAAPSNPNATSAQSGAADVTSPRPLTRRHALLQRDFHPSPADPNGGRPEPRPPRSSKAGTELRAAAPRGTCDPNLTGEAAAGDAVMPAAKRGGAPLSLGLKGCRAAEPWKLSSVPCDPNQAGADAAGAAPAAAAGSAQRRAYSATAAAAAALADPNTVNDDVGHLLRAAAERRAREDGDRVFSPPSAPTAPCDPNLAGEGDRKGRLSAKGHGVPHPGGGPEAPLFAQRKGRVPVPGQRSADAEHPLEGRDPLVLAGPYSEDGRWGGVLGKGQRGHCSRARADACGIIRQDERSEVQPHAGGSPASRRRFLAQPCADALSPTRGGPPATGGAGALEAG
eukprot:TRINITY_DN5570_c1_g1_i4.p1 TRINITY_DN5570_c1_g1~~TRINITY_DN5570_c1_g1_i4.p1  ORF type:complete len:1222 (+),score=247.33 TRINITY_DN5570_c1_g1_i4:121-3666(+)